MKQREVGLQEAQLEGYDAAILTQRYSTSKAVYDDAKKAHSKLLEMITALAAVDKERTLKFDTAYHRLTKACVVICWMCI
jgi:hypothetical protein